MLPRPTTSSNTLETAVANDGKEAEDIVRQALMLLERQRAATFLRLYDSRSAGLGSGGNVIPPQPADYVVALNGVTSLLEVKSSERHESLRFAVLRDTFSEDQMLGVKLWSRAGNRSLVAFFSVALKKFELWDGLVIREAYFAPPRQRSLKSASPLAMCSGAAMTLMLSLESVLKQQGK